MVKDSTTKILNQKLYERHIYSYHRENIPMKCYRVLRIDSRWDSPFKRLEYLSNEIPMIREIILLGVIDQVRLDEYLTELNISLEALGIKEEVKLDYSKVRVIYFFTLRKGVFRMGIRGRHFTISTFKCTVWKRRNTDKQKQSNQRESGHLKRFTAYIVKRNQP